MQFGNLTNVQKVLNIQQKSCVNFNFFAMICLLKKSKNFRKFIFVKVKPNM